MEGRALFLKLKTSEISSPHFWQGPRTGYLKSHQNASPKITSIFSLFFEILPAHHHTLFFVTILISWFQYTKMLDFWQKNQWLHCC
jgi:hypothetical protein